MMGNPSVAKIINFGARDPCPFVVAVNSSSDISDEKWSAGFGDEEGFIGSFCAFF